MSYVRERLTAAGYIVETQPYGNSENLIAETRGGRPDRVVMVGAHLDSTPASPGVNGNGSGSAAVLETAIKMAELEIRTADKVRFVWWGGGETGQSGSGFYVNSLAPAEVADIMVYLDFDTIASPNFVRFVYDGDGSDSPSPGPIGSEEIEDVLLDHFNRQGLPTLPAALNSTSDYSAFRAACIAVGGITSGSTGLKATVQATIFGGTAGDQYDPCSGLACDTIDNRSSSAVDQMSDAVAQVVATFAGVSQVVCDGETPTILGSDDADTLEGTEGDDVIAGLGGDDKIHGLEGSDMICGGPGRETIFGGAGDDRVFGNGGRDTLNGGNGNDTMKGGSSADVMRGQGGTDILAGGNGADAIHGGGKSDVISGNGGRDTISGGKGADTIFGGSGADQIKGNAGNDTLRGNKGPDLLRGGKGTDVCVGGAGQDTKTSCER